MYQLESFKIAIEEYERITKEKLTDEEKKIFSYAYGMGFIDSGTLITGLLVK